MNTYVANVHFKNDYLVEVNQRFINQKKRKKKEKLTMNLDKNLTKPCFHS